MEEITDLQKLRSEVHKLDETGDKKPVRDCKKRKLLLQYLGFKFQNEDDTENIVGLNGISCECKIDKDGMLSTNSGEIKVRAGEPGSRKDLLPIHYIVLCDDSELKAKNPCIYFHKFNGKKQWTKELKEEMRSQGDAYTDNRIEDLKEKLKEIIMGNRSDSSGENVIDIIKENIQSYKQVIFTGAPGTGKTYGVRKVVEDLCGEHTERMKFVQFHPSYDYTDFVEGLRPVKLEGDKEATFVRLDGTFKKFCRIAAADPVNNYYFIADEINRADLSKVFGELMFGLEESKRGQKFDTQYVNLPTYEVKVEVENGVKKKVITEIEEDVFEDGFFIPENLYFIGTMNDIDRSVESFDFALRRRFRWVEIEADAIMESSLGNMLKNVTDEAIKALTINVKELNREIESSGLGLTKAYHIGPAYLEGFDGTNAGDIFEHRIEPLLREYTRGRDNEKVNGFIKTCRTAFLKSSEEK